MINLDLFYSNVHDISLVSDKTGVYTIRNLDFDSEGQEEALNRQKFVVCCVKSSAVGLQWLLAGHFLSIGLMSTGLWGVFCTLSEFTQCVQSDKFQKCFTACKLVFPSSSRLVTEFVWVFIIKQNFIIPNTIVFRGRIAIKLVTAIGFAHVKDILNILSYFL